ncbi:MAG: site-specific integrase [Desulfovibrio sp.]|nr:site-specific integrase [Desulfovibrio sp.]MBI4961155.1 site-specific integrase [Desulfovibrio sp.]
MTTKTNVIEKLRHPYKITLYKNGTNANIYYYFTFKKKSYRGSTGTDSVDKAIDVVSEIYFGVKKGKDPKAQKGDSVKFEVAVAKFLEYKLTEGNIAPKTLKEYTRQSRYLVEKLGSKSIDSFTAKDFLEYEEWRVNYYKTHAAKKKQVYVRDGKKVTGRTFDTVGNSEINRECTLIGSILRHAKRYMNALQGKDVPVFKNKKERIREDILTKDEYLALEDYWMKENPYYWQIISFVNNTGIRYPSELCRITWGDVDLLKSYVVIRDRKSKGKTPLHSSVPLVGRAREIIEQLGNRQNIPKGHNDIVFVNDNGVQIKNINKAFKKSLEACGIEKDISMYSLRHLFITRMMKRPDIPMQMIASTVGHVDTTMVERRYSHLRTADIVEAFKRSEDNKKEFIAKMKRQIEELEQE